MLQSPAIFSTARRVVRDGRRDARGTRRRGAVALETTLFLISDAYAQAAGAASASPGFTLESLALPAVMIVAFYFVLIRPQQKRAKEQRTMMEALKSGDEVITSGGLLGRVSKVVDQYVTIEVGNVVGGNTAVEMTIQKSAVSALLPKGTIKAI
jgi:preprotein translocase subunit YajC